MKIFLTIYFLNTTFVNLLKNQILKTRIIPNIIQQQPFYSTKISPLENHLRDQNEDRKFVFLNQETDESGWMYTYSKKQFQNKTTIYLYSPFMRIMPDATDHSCPKISKIENPCEILSNVLIQNSFLSSIHNKKSLSHVLENINIELKNYDSFLNSELKKYEIDVKLDKIILVFKKIIDGLNVNRFSKLSELNLLDFIIHEEIMVEFREELCQKNFKLLNIATEIFNFYQYMYFNKGREPYNFNIYEMKEKM